MAKEEAREEFAMNGHVVVEEMLPLSTLSQFERGIEDIFDQFATPGESRDDVFRRLATKTGEERTLSEEVSQLFRQLPSYHALEQWFAELFEVLFPQYDTSLTVLLDILIGYPEDEDFLNWHQEAAYMGEKEILNLWFPLFRDATPETGAMRMLEGSHSQGTFETEIETHFPELGKPVRNRTPVNIDELVADHEEVYSSVPRGGVVALDSDLVHMSGDIADDSVRVTGIAKLGPVRNDLPTQYPNILALSPQRD